MTLYTDLIKYNSYGIERLLHEFYNHLPLGRRLFRAVGTGSLQMLPDGLVHTVYFTFTSRSLGEAQGVRVNPRGGEAVEEEPMVVGEGAADFASRMAEQSARATSRTAAMLAMPPPPRGNRAPLIAQKRWDCIFVGSTFTCTGLLADVKSDLFRRIAIAGGLTKYNQSNSMVGVNVLITNPDVASSSKRDRAIRDNVPCVPLPVFYDVLAWHEMGGDESAAGLVRQHAADGAITLPSALSYPGPPSAPRGFRPSSFITPSPAGWRPQAVLFASTSEGGVASTSSAARPRDASPPPSPRKVQWTALAECPQVRGAMATPGWLVSWGVRHMSPHPHAPTHPSHTPFPRARRPFR